MVVDDPLDKGPENRILVLVEYGGFGIGDFGEDSYARVEESWSR